MWTLQLVPLGSRLVETWDDEPAPILDEGSDPGEEAVDWAEEADCPAVAPDLPLVLEGEPAEGAPSSSTGPIEESGPPTAGFVVSLTKSNWRRLHRIGGCSRMPGIHYLRFELLGLDKPRVDMYDDFCRWCWPALGPDEVLTDDAQPLLVVDHGRRIFGGSGGP